MGFLSAREMLVSEVAHLVIMSCRRNREQMEGVGGSDAKVEQAATEEDEADDVDEEEEEWSEEEETDRSQATNKKNK